MSHQAKPPVASPYDYGWQKGSNGPTPILFFRLVWQDLYFAFESYNFATTFLATHIEDSRSGSLSCERSKSSADEETVQLQFCSLVWCHQTSFKIWFVRAKVERYVAENVLSCNTYSGFKIWVLKLWKVRKLSRWRFNQLKNRFFSNTKDCYPCMQNTDQLWFLMGSVTSIKDGRRYIPVHDLCSSLSSITCYWWFCLVWCHPHLCLNGRSQNVLFKCQFTWWNANKGAVFAGSKSDT
jgi:hypothetical protein